ncbi:MAG: acetone carboxylase subunit gamma [Pseudomonadota bacterium]
MKYLATEYLQINLATENWECRSCGCSLGNARENFKKFTRIYKRNPQEIHRPKLDPERYEFTFSPDPKICAIYEFYCPECGTMLDVEYTVPGHVPMHDFELDVDSLKARAAGESPEHLDPGVGVDVTPMLRAGAHDHSSHSDH